MVVGPSTGDVCDERARRGGEIEVVAWEQLHGDGPLRHALPLGELCGARVRVLGTPVHMQRSTQNSATRRGIGLQGPDVCAQSRKKQRQEFGLVAHCLGNPSIAGVKFVEKFVPLDTGTE